MSNGFVRCISEFNCYWIVSSVYKFPKYLMQFYFESPFQVKMMDRSTAPGISSADLDMASLCDTINWS